MMQERIELLKVIEIVKKIESENSYTTKVDEIMNRRKSKEEKVKEDLVSKKLKSTSKAERFNAKQQILNKEEK